MFYGPSKLLMSHHHQLLLPILQKRIGVLTYRSFMFSMLAFIWVQAKNLKLQFSAPDRYSWKIQPICMVVQLKDFVYMVWLFVLHWYCFISFLNGISTGRNAETDIGCQFYFWTMLNLIDYFLDVHLFVQFQLCVALIWSVVREGLTIFGFYVNFNASLNCYWHL